MKKLIITNLILIITFYCIPGITKIETNNTQVNIPISILVNRSAETVIKYKNYNLTFDTDLRISTNLTAEDYENILPIKLKGIGQSLEQAENDFKVNGLYLLGLICLESAYGTSSFAVNRNNLVGWNANDNNPNGASYFNSKSECILKVAEKLQKNYLTIGGCYFNGYTGQAVDIRYCSDKSHFSKIISIVNKLVKGVE
jgi:beta-N-acetylglucosaminidase